MKENNNNSNNQKEKLDLYTWWEKALQNIEIVINQLFSLTTLIWFAIVIIIGYIGVKISYIYLPITDIADTVNYSINTFLNIFTSIVNIESKIDIQQILAILFVVGLLVFLSIPHKSRRMTRILKELQITDNKKLNGNTAILTSDRRYKYNSKIRCITMISNGLIADDFKQENNLQRISKKIKCYVIDVIPHEKNNNKLLLYYKKNFTNNILEWKPEYLQQNDCSLVLGQNDIGGLEIASLDEQAHWGIFGSTGSGKSVELASLLTQALLKNTMTQTAGTKVILAEFSKRGIDWQYWKNLKNCDVYTKPNLFLDCFNSYIVPKVEKRADLLEKYNCKKISDYNKMIDNSEIEGDKLERIIIALDEAGQVFIPSQDKEREEILKPIRSALNKLITEYRFCGIHLFIASQIPSSKIFSEEIRHLTDLKMCGISTPILSEMAIGTEEASNIPKKLKGRFITNEGKAFQGFMFRENEIFKNYPKNESESN